MAGREAHSAPARERRSHAERTAETRGKILRAVVECIAELGFQRTTANEITRRAGVTWGAVQHHFGGKDGILLAVLEDSFERFADRLANLEVENVPLETRVGAFIDRAWEHFRSDHYRSTFEILLHYGASGDDDERAWRSEMFRALNRIWSRVFSDVSLPRGRRVTLQHYTISVLSGLASMRMLEGPVAQIRSAELDLLKETLLQALDTGENAR